MHDRFTYEVYDSVQKNDAFLAATAAGIRWARQVESDPTGASFAPGLSSNYLIVKGSCELALPRHFN